MTTSGQLKVGTEAPGWYLPQLSLEKTLKKSLLYPALACATVTGCPPPTRQDYLLWENPKTRSDHSCRSIFCTQSREEQIDDGRRCSQVKTQKAAALGKRDPGRDVPDTTLCRDRFGGSAHENLHPFCFCKRKHRLLIPTGNLGRL